MKTLEELVNWCQINPEQSIFSLPLEQTELFEALDKWCNIIALHSAPVSFPINGQSILLRIHQLEAVFGIAIHQELQNTFNQCLATKCGTPNRNPTMKLSTRRKWEQELDEVTNRIIFLVNHYNPHSFKDRNKLIEYSKRRRFIRGILKRNNYAQRHLRHTTITPFNTLSSTRDQFCLGILDFQD